MVRDLDRMPQQIGTLAEYLEIVIRLRTEDMDACIRAVRLLEGLADWTEVERRAPIEGLTQHIGALFIEKQKTENLLADLKKTSLIDMGPLRQGEGQGV